MPRLGWPDAQRPLILAGPGALTRPAASWRCSAAKPRRGVPVIGMESPRGVADPSLGDFAAVLARCDAVLLLGKRLDFTLQARPPAAAAPRCVSRRSTPRPKSSSARGAPSATGCATRQALADLPARDALNCAVAVVHATRPHRLARRGAAGPGLASGRLGAGAQPARPGQLHPVQALRPAADPARFSHPACRASSATAASSASGRRPCLHAPQRLINGSAGSIGSALPLRARCRAARWAPSAPVVAVMGDGTCRLPPRRDRHRRCATRLPCDHGGRQRRALERRGARSS
ncbi:MAG: hypothetical protein MZW92_41050 [Comamonadaceae bacterium]|nr:hypothetical protein [Comamonadaceae bacterium]